MVVEINVTSEPTVNGPSRFQLPQFRTPKTGPARPARTLLLFPANRWLLTTVTRPALLTRFGVVLREWTPRTRMGPPDDPAMPRQNRMGVKWNGMEIFPNTKFLVGVLRNPKWLSYWGQCFVGRFALW
ncbi:hypothetical protein KQX54_018150 [Cotesia glomerata]|uniref:Uncharacterized protein n=1 Tax=Cotesia glomerata TaxID=32391 RepID=A0AAV7HY99_COTGL|nr:hypothetical protein KQX54_018150 [Cotesia glomerata]